MKPTSPALPMPPLRLADNSAGGFFVGMAGIKKRLLLKEGIKNKFALYTYFALPILSEGLSPLSGDAPKKSPPALRKLKKRAWLTSVCVIALALGVGAWNITNERKNAADRKSVV